MYVSELLLIAKEYVFLLKEEYEKLISDFGEKIIESKIEDLDFYIGANPKKRNKYTDHNRTIRAWLKKDGIKKIQKDIVCQSCKTALTEAEVKNGKCPVCGDALKGV